MSSNNTSSDEKTETKLDYRTYVALVNHIIKSTPLAVRFKSFRLLSKDVTDIELLEKHSVQKSEENPLNNIAKYILNHHCVNVSIEYNSTTQLLKSVTLLANIDSMILNKMMNRKESLVLKNRYFIYFCSLLGGYNADVINERKVNKKFYKFFNPKSERDNMLIGERNEMDYQDTHIEYSGCTYKYFSIKITFSENASLDPIRVEAIKMLESINASMEGINKELSKFDLEKYN